MRMFRGWFQHSKWWPCLRIILPKSSVLLCFFFFFGETKGSTQRIFIKKCFLFTVGNVCPIKLCNKHSADDEEVKTEVRKWLRQSKVFCVPGFDALVKRWDKCISVSARYVEK
jgi:hypothetical protein